MKTHPIQLTKKHVPMGRRPKKPVHKNGILYWKCSKCSQLKESHEFGTRNSSANGLRSWCKLCEHESDRIRARNNPKKNAAKMRKWRGKNPEKWKALMLRSHLRHPEKKIAQKKVYSAKRSGNLIPEPCEVCGTTENIHAHHDDYEKPLNVRWLCRTHHNEEHYGPTKLDPVTT